MPVTRHAKRNTGPSVALIGLGNWGTSLAYGLLSAGMTPREIILRNSTSRRLSGLPALSWKKARLDAKILWLCVPDSAIPEVVARLAEGRSLRGQTVVHSSGALTVDVLEAVRKAGALTAAVHPVMTFPTRSPVPLSRVLFGVEASSPAVRGRLNALIRRLGGTPFRIDSSGKALYHAAGTLASPLLVSVLTAAIETARAAGLRQHDASDMVQALAQATVRNVFTQGAHSSFSGPFARGDASTVKLHLQALDGHPILEGVYRSLAVHALESLPVRDRPALLRALAAGRNRKASGTGRPRPGAGSAQRA